MPFQVEAELQDFERTTGEYGPKLRFEVVGDTKQFEKQIDRCEWKGETFHQNLYGNTWEIDRTPKSFDAVERETGIEIDRAWLVPEDAHANLKIPRGSMFIKMVDVDEAVQEILKQELSYTESYWDQNKRQEVEYQKDVIMSDGIPIGLKEDVIDLLEEFEIPYTIPDYRQEPGWGQVDYEWNFPYELRDYQRMGVSKMMQGSRVIQFPTGAGKTVTALRTVHELGLQTLILVHQIDLLEQWRREIKEQLGVEAGVIQGDREEYRDITVAMIPTLSNRIDNDPSFRIDDFDVVIADEVHHLDAETYFDVALKAEAYYRYGLSATVEEGTFKDSEMLKIIGVIGPNDLKVTPVELIERGYLAKPKFEWLYPKKISGNYDGWQDAYKRGIVQNDDRNGIITEKLEELIDNDRSVLVDVQRIEHGIELLERSKYGLIRDEWDPNEEDLGLDHDFSESEANSWPIPIVHNGKEVVGWSATGRESEAIRLAIENTEKSVFWVSGKDGGETRELLLDYFRNGEINGMISTLLREGVDVPELDAVVLAGGGKSAIQLIQTIGRSLRPEGSDDAIIVDCKDQGEYVGSHMLERVRAMNRYYGKYMDSVPLGVDL